jgi:acyl dehydratase
VNGRLHFEDFVVGQAVPYGAMTVDRDAMVAFAKVHDAQSMHVDEQAARRTLVGELIASGWYTAALNMRLMADGFILQTAGLGAPGVEELRWLRPVRAGDTLAGMRHVLGKRVSQSKPDRGFVRFRFELTNQRGEIVFGQTGAIMIERRGSEALPDEGEAASPAAEPVPVRFPSTRDDLPYLEDLVIGEELLLGERRFSAADIVAFATDFDPQPFHLSEEAAARTHFGRLSASGWHTAANWMATMVERRFAGALAMRARGARPAKLGPSPGFRDLRWLKPVHAGDTITYRSAVVEARPSATRPGWGIVRHFNTGTNQRGEMVFSFFGAVLWERQPV